MRTKITRVVTLLLVLLVHATFAQQRTISGTVSDESGPLPGVNVIIKGTSTGTQTDFDGIFTITASTGDILVFSYVGMATKEVTVGTSDTMDVIMTGANLLEEVVVVGYGTSTKQSFTGTAKVVKSELLETKSVSNVSQALAGEIAGVRVINNSGQPGSASTIRIRGFGSVNGNRAPLYVVDGVPFNGSINSINPSDIASTTVLKDATATAIYGARGANGVIVITTKSGSSSESLIDVEVKYGSNQAYIPRYDIIKNPEQFIGLSWEALYNRGLYSGEADPTAFANATLFSGGGIDPKYNMWNITDVAQLIDPATGMVRPGVTRKYNPENWEDYGFQDSNRFESNLKFSGGSEKTKYFSSVGFLDDVGYVINSDFKRYSTRLNLSHEVKPWLSGNVNLGYAVSESTNNGQSEDSGSIFWFVDNIPSIFPLYLRDEAGNYVPDPIFGGNQYDYGIGRDFGALTNSIADAHYDSDKTKRHELNGNFSVDVDITEGLSFKSQYGMQYYNNRRNALNNPFYGSAASIGGSIYKVDIELFSANWLNMFRYKKIFGDDHNLEVLAAHESNQWERKVLTASKSKAVHPNITDLNNFIIVSSPPTSYTDQVRLESYFAQANYNYQGKYFVSGSVRRDGSSRFVKDKWDTFGSIGGSWIATKEDFMTDVDWLNFAKFKMSWGVIGEQAGVGFYPGYATFDIGNLNDEYSIPPRDIGNPDLTWETSKMFQTGLELNIIDIFDINLDYYIKNTENLLFDRRVGPSVGYALQTVNDGALKNSGFEFDVNVKVLNKADYKVDFSFNGEVLSNKLTKMPFDPAINEEKILDQQGIYGRAAGRSLFDFYMREWAGVDPEDGLAQWNLYYDDKNGNDAFDSGERIGSLTEYAVGNPDMVLRKTTTKKYKDATEKYVGKNAIPKLRGAFRLGAKIKDFDVSAQFLYSLGGYAYDGAYRALMNNETIAGNNWHKDIFNRWQQPGDITDVPRLSDNFDTNTNSTSTRFLTKADYLNLSNIKIGYTLPATTTKSIGMKHLNVFVTGDNLFVASARRGFDPSTSETGASDTYRYTPLSTFSVGLKASF